LHISGLDHAAAPARTEERRQMLAQSAASALDASPRAVRSDAGSSRTRKGIGSRGFGGWLVPVGFNLSRPRSLTALHGALHSDI